MHLTLCAKTRTNTFGLCSPDGPRSDKSKINVPSHRNIFCSFRELCRYQQASAHRPPLQSQERSYVCRDMKHIPGANLERHAGAKTVGVGKAAIRWSRSNCDDFH